MNANHPANPALMHQIDELCDRFEQVFRSGKRPKITEFVGEVSTVEEKQALIRELISLELELLDELQQQVDVTEYIQQLPEHEELIRTIYSKHQSKNPETEVLPTLANLKVGQSLGVYSITHKLGEGGMGQVYRAHHNKMQRDVALKVLSPKLVSSTEAVARFHREITAAAKLQHTNIVSAYDAGDEQGLHFLVMEYVEGEELGVFVQKNGRLKTKVALKCIQQAAQGLSYAHERGIIHRDIKPNNLMVDKRGTLKILDMGLARLEMEEFNTSSKMLTDSGMIMGTVDYMAPEQSLDTRTADARSDIYSLGCTLFYLLTAKPMYNGDTTMKRLIAHREQSIPDLQSIRNSVPDDVVELFRKMVAKEPADRFQSMDEVVEAINALSLTTKPVPVDSKTTSTEPELDNFLLQISPDSPTRKHQSEVDSESVMRADIDTETVRHPSARRNRKQRGRKSRSDHGSRNNLPQWAVWGGGLFAFLLLAGIITIVTKKGTVTVDIADKMKAGVEVKIKTVDGDKEVAILDKQNNWTVNLSGGEYSIDLAGGNDEFSLKKDTLTVSRFGKNVVKIVYTPNIGNADNKTRIQSTEGWADWPADAPAPAIAPFDAKQAKKHQQEWARYLGVPVEKDVVLGKDKDGKDVVLTMVLIPPGEFQMGSTKEQVEKATKDLVEKYGNEKEPNQKALIHQSERFPLESPQHKVKITRPFWMATNEVTKAHFRQFVRDTKFKTEAERDGVGGRDLNAQSDPKLNWDSDLGFAISDDFPVANVTWNDSTDFCKWISKSNPELKFSLPSEAQWEYACRAGTTSSFYRGDSDDALKLLGWAAPWSKWRPHPIGKMLPNPFGLHDMHGNVWEWCQDFFGEEFYDRSPVSDPIGPAFGDQRIMRGGSFRDYSTICRTPYRHYWIPSGRYEHVGFRVAAAVEGVDRLLVKNNLETKNQVRDPWAAEREVAEWVIQQGGRVNVLLPNGGAKQSIKRIDDLPEKPFSVVVVYLQNTQVSSADLAKRVSRLPNLSKLYVDDTSIDVDAIKAFPQDHELHTLSIIGTNISTSQLKNPNLPNSLRQLQLTTDQVDDSWRFLTECKNTRFIYVSRAADFSSIENAGKHQHLRQIWFGGYSTVSSKLVNSLQAQNPSLRILAGFNGKAQSQGIDPWKKPVDSLVKKGFRIVAPTSGGTLWDSAKEQTWNEQNTVIEIGEIWFPAGLEINDEVISALNSFDFRAWAAICGGLRNADQLATHLKTWALASTAWTNSDLTDAGLDALASVQGLHTLKVQGTKVTRQGIENFKRKRPMVFVSSDFGDFPIEYERLAERANDTNRRPPHVNLEPIQPSDEVPYARDRAAAEYVLNCGGQVDIVSDKNQWLKATSIDKLPKSSFRLTNVVLTGIKNVTDKGVKLLAGLPSLDYVSLSGTNIDKQSLRYLAFNPNLRMLTLNNTSIRASDLVELKHAPSLRFLQLDIEQLDSWAFLNQLKTVNTLMLFGKLQPPEPRVDITSSNLNSVWLAHRSGTSEPTLDVVRKSIKNLAIIHGRGDRLETSKVLGIDPMIHAVTTLKDRGCILSGTTVNDASWDSSKELNHGNRPFKIGSVVIPPNFQLSKDNIDLLKALNYELFMLEFRYAKNADTACQLISEHFALANLNFEGSDISDEGLKSLAKIAGLDLLNLKATKVSKEAILEFKKHVPTCKVLSNFGTFPYEHKLPIGWQQVGDDHQKSDSVSATPNQNWALKLETPGDHVRIPTPNIDDENITVEFLINCPKTNQSRTEIFIAVGPMFVQRLHNNFWVTGVFTPKGQIHRGTRVQPEIGVPHHVAVVRTPKSFRWWIDGIERKPPLTFFRNEDSKVVPFEWSDGIDLFKGKGSSIGSYSKLGTPNCVIDEIRISNTARYAKDFKPMSRLQNDEQTFALYRCDEGQRKVLKDSSGNGRHGEIVGAKWVQVDETLTVVDAKKSSQPANQYELDRTIAKSVVAVGGKICVYNPMGNEEKFFLGKLPMESEFGLSGVQWPFSLKVKSDSLVRLQDLPMLNRLTGNFRDPADAIRKIAMLKQLDTLTIHPLDIKERDLEPLSRLPRLRSLAITTSQIENGEILKKFPALREMQLLAENESEVPIVANLKNLRLLRIPSLESISHETVQKVQSTNPNVRIVVGKADRRRLIGKDPLIPVLTSLMQKGVTFTGAGMPQDGRWTDAGDTPFESGTHFYVDNIEIPETVSLSESEAKFIDSTHGYLYSIRAQDLKSSDVILPTLVQDCFVSIIDVINSDLTDTGLKQLHEMAHLRTLDIRGTNVTKEGVLEFKKHVPTCKVLSNFGTFPYEHTLPVGW